MSEIWNEFEKIACAQGLVSVDQDEDGLVSVAQDEGRKQEDPSKMPTRYDSVADDAIRLLYGIEPDSIYDKDKTIIENAHPETAVVGRAYDAMNAVVENLHQRQDMMAYIALKQPNGHLTMRRYVAAKQDLVNSLVRSAFLLDNREESELMALADNCAERLEKKSQDLTKEAVGVVGGVAIAGAAAAVLAATYWFAWGATTAQNVYANAHIALEYLDPLIANATSPDLRQDLNVIKKDLQKIMKDAQDIYRMKGELVQVRSAFDAKEKTAAEEAKAEAIKARLEKYVDQLLKLRQVIPGWVAAIKSEYEMSTEQTSDWWAKMRGVEQYLPEFMQGQRFADEKFIEKLWGKPSWGSQFSGMFGGGNRSEQSQAGGQVGGLLEAVDKEAKMIAGLINKANYDVQAAPPLPQAAPQQSAPQQSAPQTPRLSEIPMAQAPAASGLPAPTPAPQPSAPGAPVQSPPAAAARRPQPKSPLEEMANQWGG